MEQKLIIAEILKHKPQGIKLYSQYLVIARFAM